MSNTYRRKGGNRWWINKNNGELSCTKLFRNGPDFYYAESNIKFHERDGVFWDQRSQFLKKAAHKDFRNQWKKQKIKILQDEEDYVNPVKAEYGDPWDWY